MKKLTLQFQTLWELGNFAKMLSIGYITNTTNLTITVNDQSIANKYDLQLYNAEIIETTEKVFSYAFAK